MLDRLAQQLQAPRRGRVHASNQIEQSGFARAGWTYDGEKFFEGHIWPALYERSSGFERLKHLTGWAGLYEMSPDAHPLIGRLEPIQNAYVVAGFSGHGFMHGPIAGKLLAEVILDGSASSLDIGVLSPTRFALHSAAPREYNVV